MSLGDALHQLHCIDSMVECGGPLSYTLVPLQFLSYFFPLGPGPAVNDADAEYLEQAISTFEGMQYQTWNSSNYLVAIEKNRFCVPPGHITEVTAIVAATKKALDDHRYDVANRLQHSRGGQSGTPPVGNLVKNVREPTPENEQNHAPTIGLYWDKMVFIDKLMALGGIYLSHITKVYPDFSAAGDRYVLFYQHEATIANRSSWEANAALMLRLVDGERDQSAVLFYDFDLCIKPATPRKLCIKHYIDGVMMSEDLADERAFAADNALASCDPTLFFGTTNPRPKDRRALKLPCPGARCNKQIDHDWLCEKCRSPIEVGERDGRFYCECGHGPSSGFSFRCTDHPTHGPHFTQYNPHELRDLIRNLKPYRELNILILGETGVGKSTFINAFINYLTYETLDDAMKEDKLQWIIPCSFSTQYLDSKGEFHQEDIKIGSRPGERDGSRGQSATQSTAVYRVQIGDRIIRLIDTPGIGDTRGIDQDKRNMAGILSTLTGFATLNGILILLKPNSARLTLMFKFCVTELLTHLHRDAAHNMVFGFTNTRTSNYMPGDAFKPLQVLLNKYKAVPMHLNRANTYCFDSESFRFLAALKTTGHRMENEEDFHRSWERSEKEAKRLLEHFSTLTPHLVKGTLSLNRARDIITKLTKPMAEIMDAINRTIRINEDHVKELADEKCKGEDLKKHLHFQKLDKKTRALSYPRTVCIVASCVQFIQGVDKMIPNYKTHCHPHCYLNEVPKEIVGHDRLMGCDAFYGRGAPCRVCSHNWKQHMHIWYELEDKLTIEREADIKKLEKRIHDHEAEVQLKQAAILKHGEKIDQARTELREIEDAAAQFGLFLKMNSITPYNDEMLAYLDEQIKEERMVVNETRSSQDRLEALISTRKEYEHQIRVLEKEMQADGKGGTKMPINERDVEALVTRLYNLKGWGSSLRDIKTATEYYRAPVYEERPFRASRGWWPEFRKGVKAGLGLGSSTSGTKTGMSGGTPNWVLGANPSSDICGTSSSYYGSNQSSTSRRTMLLDGINDNSFIKQTGSRQEREVGEAAERYTTVNPQEGVQDELYS